MVDIDKNKIEARMRRCCGSRQAENAAEASPPNSIVRRGGGMGAGRRSPSLSVVCPTVALSTNCHRNIFV